MTFLTPTTGIAVGAIGAAVLLSLYLLKLRRRPLRVSSTLLWEQAVQDLQVNTPFRWLRASLLLFIQLTALAALALAAARPMLGSGDEAVSSRIVIIIDTSASMSARDALASERGPIVSRFDQARSEARAIVSRLDRGGGSASGPPRAMIVALAAHTRALTTFTSSTSELLDAIDALQSTDQPTDIDSALAFIRAQGAGDSESVPTPQRPTVFLISDGNFTAPAPGSSGFGGLDIRSIHCGPPTTPNAPPPASPAGTLPDNLGIVAIDARPDPDDSSLIRIFVRIQNAGTREISTVLRCTVDGAQHQTLPIVVPAAPDTDSSEAPTPAGEASATLELSNLWVSPTAGPAADRVVTVSIDRADLLAADDAAAVVLRPPQPRRALIVAPAQTPDPFVMGAIEAACGISENTDSTTASSVIRVIDEPTYSAQAAAELEPWSSWDLVIFDRIEPAVLPAVPSLSLGAGLPSLGIAINRPTRDSSTDFARVVTWQRFHPILRYVALDTLVLAPPAVIAGPVGNSASNPGAPAQQPIAKPLSFESLADSDTTGPRSGAGAILALARDSRGLSRLIVAFDIAHSTWGPDVSFPIFIANVLDVLSGSGGSSGPKPSSGMIAHTTRDPITLPLTGVASRVRVSGPLALTVERALPGDNAFQLGVLPRAGLYTLTPEPSAAGAVPFKLAVNLADPLESSLRSLPIPVTISGSAPPPGSATWSMLDSQSREIWHWFVALAGALLTLEWLLYAWRMRS